MNLDDNRSDPDAPKRFGIGAVARLTGISTHTLRVWERRYDVVALARTEGGRRLYTSEDVERLSLLKRLVDRGESIGQIAGLSRPDLEDRLRDFERHANERLADDPGRYRVGIFGEFLGVPIEDALAGTDIVTRAIQLDRFRTDLRHAKPDLLMLEIPIITADTYSLVGDLLRTSGAERVVIVYDYGRRDDIGRLAEAYDAVLRAPVSADDLARALAALTIRRPKAATPAADHKQADAALPAQVDIEVPRRNYTRRQLARLAALPASVECECPVHLVELIDRLSLFEDYSADCENRNNDDAALHAYLHATTAQARALIETALTRIIQAEGLDAGPR